MNYKLDLDYRADIAKKYKLSIISNIVLSVSILMISVYAIHSVNQRRVIIIPSHLNTKVEFKGETADPEYIRIMSLHMVRLLYSYTPTSISNQYKEFLAYTPHEKWEGIKGTLQNRINQIIKLKIKETFLPEQVNLLNKNIVAIKGMTIRWSAGQELAQENVYLKLTYLIENGGFRVQEMSILTSSEYSALLHDDAGK